MAPHKEAVIGSAENFWLHSDETGFNLTHPPTPASAPVHPQVSLQTTTAQVAIDPAKSALIVVDMQNFFLSHQLGRPKDGKGIMACEQLIKYAIPACRKAGIRVIWLNWGLTDEDIDKMPPATLTAFGFLTLPREHSDRPPGPCSPSTFFKRPRDYKGLGSELGSVELEDGTTVDAGRLLMRDQWNSALYPPLEATRKQKLGKGPADTLIHKNRMSGLWGNGTPCTAYLEQQGIKTLLFAGVNTDQCVLGSMADAFTKGYDCLMLSDACATTTPDGQACVEYNVARTMGFLLSCEALAKGVEGSILE